MKHKIYFFTIATAIILFSCTSSEQPVEALRPEEGQEAIKMEVVASFEQWGINNPRGIVKSNHSVAVANRTSHHNISLVKLGDFTRTDRITRSRHNGQALHTNALDGSASHEITALNFQSGQLYVTPQTGNEWRGTYCIQLPEGVQHLTAAKSGKRIVATGLYEQGRYLLYSPEDGSTGYFLSYPEHPDHPGLDEYTKSALYASSVLRIRPDGQAFACSDMRSGLLDICRIEGDKIERIQQLCFYYPQVHISGNSPKNLKIAYDKNTIHGFMDVAVSNERIYVLYSGKSKKQDRYNLTHCQTLITFDWAGNQTDLRSLEMPVSNICYDAEENTLYGIGYTPEAAIVKFIL